MRLVVATEEGVVELNYMWLPTWLGLNAALQKTLESKVQEHAVGKPLTEETLDYLHVFVIGVIQSLFPTLDGLSDYLDGLKFVTPK